MSTFPPSTYAASVPHYTFRRWCWAACWTLPFALLLLLTGASPYARRPEGVWWFVARRGPWKWFYAWTGYTATTLGSCTLSTVAVQDAPKVIRHERTHTRQAYVLGPAYVPVYVRDWVQCSESYRGNPMEREAYVAQENPDL